MTRARILAGLALSALFAGQAAAADKLTLYCSAQEDWCQLMARSFEEATGIDVDMTRKSSGETFAQIRAEASNPRGDVWWGGTGDPHLQAAEEGLFTHFMGGIVPDKARETFGIPEGFEAITGLAIGYRADPADLPEKLRERDTTARTRRPQKEFVFGAAWGTAWTPLS